MGTLVLAACHSCHKYINLDKFQTLFYLTGRALEFRFKDSDGKYDKEQLYYALDVDDLRYQLYHAHKLLRFLAIHDECNTKMDLLYAEGDDEDQYIFVIKNYEEVDFKEDLDDRWGHVWERSQENISYLDDLCKMNLKEDLMNFPTNSSPETDGLGLIKKPE